MGSCEESGQVDSSLHATFCRSPGDVSSAGLAGPSVPQITVFLLYRFIPKNTALSSAGGCGESLCAPEWTGHVGRDSVCTWQGSAFEPVSSFLHPPSLPLPCFFFSSFICFVFFYFAC